VGPGLCLWAGIPLSIAPRHAQSQGRSHCSSLLPSPPFAFFVFPPSFPSSFPSSFFILSFSQPPSCGPSSLHLCNQSFEAASPAALLAQPSSLHLRTIGGCITSPPHHWRLHHFTSSSLEAASLHLRTIGGCITSPPHHWRLHHFTSASLEAASLHLRIFGGCINHFTSASLEAAPISSSVCTHR